MRPTLEEIIELRDYLATCIDPPPGCPDIEPDPEPVYCDGTLKFTRSYLEQIGRIEDIREFTAANECDCEVVMNWRTILDPVIS